MRVLLCEDDRKISKALVKIFEFHNYSVDAVYDGEDAIAYIESLDYDVVILDIMMPKMDGVSVLKHVRGMGVTVPILMLTAKATIDDKVTGLDFGANDYLTKPFDAKELMARIRAITRKSTDSTSFKLRYGNVSLNCKTFVLSTDKAFFKLAGKEFQMMEMLMKNERIVIPTEQFLEKIWGLDSDVEINIVWVYISYLRKKLTLLDADIKISAIRNTGYSLEKKSD